jgi:hypothetical protein
MDVKISEEKLEKITKIIYSQLDRMIDLNRVHMTNPYTYDMDTHEEYEEPYVEIYYYDDWLGEDDSDKLFTYFYSDYYNDEPSSVPNKEKSPILEINDENLYNFLESMGIKLSFPVVKKWFEDKFNLPVKSVESYY